jgi:ATP-dependent Clp protease ATP-binding subunit ClpX
MHDSSDSPVEVRCAFCTKTPDEVRHMVAGPGVYICDECVDAARKVIADHRAGKSQE